MTVLTADFAEYSAGAYWAVNNTGGKGSLVNGVDYTQSITINDSTFPDGTVLSWSWPSTNTYYGFPAVIYGSGPGNPPNPAVEPTQVDNFANLSATYSITPSGSGNTNDTIFDMWLTSQPNGGPTDIQYEVEIVVQRPAGWGVSPSTPGFAYALSDSTLTNADVIVAPGYSNGVDTWTNVKIEPQSNMLSGTISISDVLNSLISHGVIPGQEYLSGVQFVAEAVGGSGSETINNLSYQWDPGQPASQPTQWTSTTTPTESTSTTTPTVSTSTTTPTESTSTTTPTVSTSTTTPTVSTSTATPTQSTTTSQQVVIDKNNDAFVFPSGHGASGQQADTASSHNEHASGAAVATPEWHENIAEVPHELTAIHDAHHAQMQHAHLL